MAKVTRTYGPIHFEDLDPKRFEDLIRELAYDYKDWQSIEATGRGGGDDGFDIRAFERVYSDRSTDTDSEDTDEKHPMVGNRWMIQCKREKNIGPKRLKAILDEIDVNDPPYGYILAASTSFSKRSFDAFREELIKKGIQEFYLWGSASLEDMLHQPKNDRILFTFFGISLVSRRRSRSTEIRLAVTNKNKLFRTLGEEPGGHSKILLRDSNDQEYPYSDRYKNFDEQPRWKEYTVLEYHPKGLVLNIAKHFAYIDVNAKEFDFSKATSLIFSNNESDEERQRQHQARLKVEDFWDHLPRRNRATIHKNGLVRFDDMLVIDDKGDTWNKFPHLFIDYQGRSGPFSGSVEFLEVERGHGTPKQYTIADWKKIEKFPEIFPDPKLGTLHSDKTLQLDPDTQRLITNHNLNIREFYDADGKYAFLKQRDVIPLAKNDPKKDTVYLQITHIETMRFIELIQRHYDPQYQRAEIERRVRRTLKDSDIISIYEFKQTYEWQLTSSVT